MPPLGRNLPGFYYDEEKNRYFPLSSRPVTQKFTAEPIEEQKTARISYTKRKRGDATDVLHNDARVSPKDHMANLSSASLLRLTALSPFSGPQNLTRR